MSLQRRLGESHFPTLLRASRFTPLALFFAVLCPIESASGTTINVPQNVATIQAGIDLAQNGDTVLVAPGTYSGAGNEGIQISGKQVVLSSTAGYASTHLLATTSQRAIILGNHVDTLTVIDGFTFDGGYDSTFAWSNPLRGGIWIDSAGPLFKNCIITNCYAANGGGVDISSGSQPIFVNCSITKNYAEQLGGGIRCFGDGTSFRNCVISSNRAAAWAGGGMLLAGRVSLLKCCVGQNKVGGVSQFDSSGYGGGVCGLTGSNLIIDSSRICQNSGEMGGGVAIIEGSLTLTNSLVYNNVARGSYAGILIDVYGSADLEGLEVSHCTFACNYAAWVGADGVAVRGFVQTHAPQTTDAVPTPAHSIGSFSVSNSVLAFSSSAAIGQFGESIPMSCHDNDVWKIVAGRRYGGNLADQTGSDGNISEEPLFCSVSDSTCTLDKSSPCLGTGTSGSNRGAFGSECDYYGGGAPTKFTVVLPSDLNVTNDTVLSAINRARPWDTLFFGSQQFRHLSNLVIDKPLYLIGTGQFTSTLISELEPQPVGLTFKSFAVAESLTISPLDFSLQQFSTGVRFARSSPILFNCNVSPGGAFNFPFGVTLEIDTASPYVRAGTLSFGYSGYLSVLNGALDGVTPNDFWNNNIDSISIAGSIVDGRRGATITKGVVIFEPFLLTIPTEVNSGGHSGTPLSTTLYQNYPNPFNQSTIIEYYLPSSSWVSLTIYNILGQRVVNLIDGMQSSGTHRIAWNGTNANGVPVASGLYVYRIESGQFLDSRKMVMLK